MSTLKARSMILAIGAVAITGAGAYAGANYKTEAEKQGIRKEYLAETAEQKIARLESRRAAWVLQREELVKKIASIEKKIEENNKKKKKEEVRRVQTP